MYNWYKYLLLLAKLLFLGSDRRVQRKIKMIHSSITVCIAWGLFNFEEKRKSNFVLHSFFAVMLNLGKIDTIMKSAKKEPIWTWNWSCLNLEDNEKL